MYPASPTPPLIPDYDLLRPIGDGSYGDVWLARGVTGAYRAVKLVWRHRFSDTRPYEREFEGLTRFAAVSLREPSQLALLHAGRQDDAGFFYYVMELADDLATGREIDPDRYEPCTLKYFLARRGGRLVAADALAIGVALARSLATLHGHGLVHRDIKLSNAILVGGVPKLSDIGLVAAASAGLTFVGTEGYVPLEGPGAPTADVYSLGKVLYELVTGHDRLDFPRLPGDFGERPDRAALLELNEVIVRACDPDPRRRPADGSAVLDELLLLQAGKSVRRLRRAERMTARTLRIATLLVIVAALTGTGAYVEHRRAEALEAQRDDAARKAAYSAGVERAQIALENGDLSRARKLLSLSVPAPGAADLRGFEWRALWRESQGDPADVFLDQGPVLQRTRVSPTGALVAAQDAEFQATLWSTDGRNVVRRIPAVYRLAGFSSDERWLVGLTLVREGTTRVTRPQRWSVATGLPDGEPTAEKGPYRIVAPIGRNRLLLFSDGTQGQPHAIRTWDFEARDVVSRMEVPRDTSGASWDFYRPDAVSASSDGSRCAVAYLAGRVSNARWKIEVYDLGSGRVLFSESTAHRINALALSPDGTKLLATLSDTAELALIDVDRASWLWRAKGRRGSATVVSFSPDGRRLAAGAANVELFDASDGSLLAELRGNGGGVEDVAWMPDGSTLFSSGKTGDLRRWHRPSTGAPMEIAGFWIPPGGGRRLCLSPDGSLLAATDAPEKGPAVHRVADGSLVARGPRGMIPIGFLSADRLLGMLPAGDIQIHRLLPDGTWELLGQDRPFAGPVIIGSSAAMSADRTTLVIGTVTGAVAFWDLVHQRLLHQVQSGNEALGFVAISPDGQRALTGGSNRSQARLWDVATGKRHAAFALAASQPLTGDFSPDGRLLALAWADGSVEIRQAPTGRLVHRVRSLSPAIQAVAFSPDSSAVFCGASDGNIHVFATQDGREVLTLRAKLANPAADNRVGFLAFSDQERALAAYVNDGRIRLWRR